MNEKITSLLYKNRKNKHIGYMQFINCIVKLYLVHTYINRRFGNYMQASLIAKICLSHVVQTYYEHSE